MANQIRDKIIMIRVTADEKKAIETQAFNKRMQVAVYIRRKLLPVLKPINKTLKVNPSQEEAIEKLHAFHEKLEEVLQILKSKDRDKQYWTNFDRIYSIYNTFRDKFHI